MILLDTDHLTALTDAHHSSHALLVARLAAAHGPIALPVVSVDEQLRGWLRDYEKVPGLRFADWLH